MAPFLLRHGRMNALARMAAASALMALTTHASATLLTFDDLGECCTYPTPTYVESGYVFTLFGGDESGPFGSPDGWHLGDGTAVPGTLNWHGAPGGTNSNLRISLTKQDGGLFDLRTLDIDILGEATLFAISAAGYAERTFEGNVLDLTRIADEPLDLFGVSEVVFRQVRGAGGGVGIDNVRVMPHQVPEPRGLSLLVLAALAFSHRCKQLRRRGAQRS